MATTKEKRRLVRERKIRRSESRWLQKALFALSKAENEHAKLLDVRGEEGGDVDVTVNGTAYPMDDVTTALRDSVEAWLEAQRATRRQGHALAR